jgi:hypothetical protein
MIGHVSITSIFMFRGVVGVIQNNGVSEVGLQYIEKYRLCWFLYMERSRYLIVLFDLVCKCQCSLGFLCVTLEVKKN